MLIPVLFSLQHRLSSWSSVTFNIEHISYDFDPSLSSAKRMEMILKRVKNNAIVVFHDSTKAFPQLEHELPLLLDKWTEAGFSFQAIQTD